MLTPPHFLALFGLVVVSCSLPAAHATEQEPLTAEELIEKLDRWKGRLEHLTVSGELKSRGSWNRGGGRSLERFTYDRDGDRFRLISSTVNFKRGNTSYDVAPTHWYVFDGEQYCYLMLPKDPDERAEAQFQRDPERAKEVAAGFWRSYQRMMTMDPTEKGNLVEVLRDAAAIRVRPGTHRVIKFKTLVLEADTAQGDITLWLSVDHDYTIVQTERVIESGDSRLGEPAPPGLHERHYYRVAELREHGGLWVPTGIIGRGNFRALDRDSRPVGMSSEVRWDIDVIEFDPAIQVEKNITLPELPVDARVSYSDDVNPNGSTRFYRWNGSEAVPE